MARNRIIYASEAIYVGPETGRATSQFFTSGNSGENLIRQLNRVQSANYDFGVTRQNVNQYGQLAAIDRVILEPPTVNLTFSYLQTNGSNEDALGFTTDGQTSMISGILAKVSDEKDYWILTVPEGQDAVGYAGNPATNGVIGIGNGFITNYEHTAAVGGFPTCNVTVQALNMNFNTNSTGVPSPAINPESGTAITEWVLDIPAAVSGLAGQPSALRPGDIILDLQNAGLGVNLQNCNIQSYTLTVPLARDPINRLGSKFAFSREITFPITVTLAIEAQLTELTTGNLSDILCNDQNYDITIKIKEPGCVEPRNDAVIYSVRGFKLASQNFTSSIGPNKTIAANFEGQIGGPQDNRGAFISGSF